MNDNADRLDVDIHEAVKRHVENKKLGKAVNGAKPEMAFETVAGLRVEFDPINFDDLMEAQANIEREYRERGEPLDRPTYTYKTAGGGEIEQEHDPTTLDVPGDPELTEANHEAWKAYEIANARLIAEQTQVQTQMVIDAINLPDGGVPEEWVARMKRYHVDVPDDPYEREYKYKLRAILKNYDDLLTAFEKILGASVAPLVPRELIDAQMDLFRGQVAAAARTALGRGGVPGEAAGGDQGGARESEGREGGGALGSQRQADGGGSGGADGPVAERTKGSGRKRPRKGAGKRRGLPADEGVGGAVGGEANQEGASQGGDGGEV